MIIRIAPENKLCKNQCELGVIRSGDCQCFMYQKDDPIKKQEPDQNILWEAVEAVIDRDLLEEYGNGYMISAVAMDHLKSKYTLIRK